MLINVKKFICTARRVEIKQVEHSAVVSEEIYATFEYLLQKEKI